MNAPPLHTTWKIKGTADRPKLDVRLTVDTTAPAVVDAIEQAASANGITLVRHENKSE